MIKRTKIDLSEERKIITHMITSTSFLNRTRNIIKPSLFASSYCRHIATWIMEYYNHTSEAPYKNIQDIYLKKRKELSNEEELETVADFLTSLSKDWESHQIQNITYSEKQATDYFKLQSLNQLKNQIDNAVQQKNAEAGEQLIANYIRIDKPSSQGVDLLTDTDAIIQAFDFTEERLFSYPGALGKAIGSFLRGDFFAILGAPKRGKSWWLWYTARRAVLMGYKAMFFSFEMSQNRKLRRAWQSFVAQPMTNKELDVPYFVYSDKDELYHISHRKENKNSINADFETVKKQQAEYRKKLRSGSIRIETYPSYSATVDDIKTRLETLEFYDGFVPDVICVDYADIIKPTDTRMQYRHQLDAIWKELRGIAQQRNCLVATASQVEAGVWEKNIRGSSSAENKNKAAHITKMMALNQSEEEQDSGAMRVQCLFTREEKRYSKEVVVLQCLDMGRTYLDSQLKEVVYGYKKD